MLALWKLVETGHAPKFAPVPKDSELTIKPNAPNDLLMGSKIEACYVLCFQYFHKMYIFSVLEVVQDIGYIFLYIIEQGPVRMYNVKILN